MRASNPRPESACITTPNRHPEHPGHARVTTPATLSFATIRALSGMKSENIRKARTAPDQWAGACAATAPPPAPRPARDGIALQASNDLVTTVAAAIGRAALSDARQPETTLSITSALPIEPARTCNWNLPIRE